MSVSNQKRIGIFTRFFGLFLFLCLILITIIFVLIIPHQKEYSIRSLESEARSVSASISQVCGNAIVNEDYSFIVEHNMEVVQASNVILYVVVARQDGYSLIHTAEGWEQKDALYPNPDFNAENTGTGQIIYSSIVKKEVFNYNYPLNYSGLKWGNLYIGLSVDGFEKEIKSTYTRMIILGLICLIIGVSGAYIIARKLTKPILALRDGMLQTARGDMTTRVEISTGDEIEDLANTFNLMIGKLNETTVSKNYMYNIINNMKDSLVVLAPDGNISMVNQATTDILGYAARDLFGKPIDTIFEHSDSSLNGEMFTEYIKKYPVKNLEINCLSKKGVRIPALFSSSTMQNAEGMVEAIVCIAVDITERKNAEDELKKYRDHLEEQVKARTADLNAINEKLEDENVERKKAEAALSKQLKEREVLIQEIHHRVKNNMQIISSLLRLQSNYITNDKIMEMIRNCQNRVDSMALVHEKLYQSKDLSKISLQNYFQSLALNLFASYKISFSSIAFISEVAESHFGPDTAVPLGLILTELISNSLKHAFPNGRKGEIRISLKEETEDYILEVTDNGQGLPDNFDFRNTVSLGLQLVDTLVDQLRGSIELERSKGTTFKIIFPKPVQLK